MNKVETNQFAEKRTRTKIFLVGSLVHLEKNKKYVNVGQEVAIILSNVR